MQLEQLWIENVQNFTGAHFDFRGHPLAILNGKNEVGKSYMLGAAVKTQSQLEEKAGGLQALEEQLERRELLRQVFGLRGALPLLIEQARPEIQGYANEMLGAAGVRERLKISLLSETGREQLDFLMRNEFGTHELTQFSLALAYDEPYTCAPRTPTTCPSSIRERSRTSPRLSSFRRCRTIAGGAERPNERGPKTGADR
jgi:hypothetical protein